MQQASRKHPLKTKQFDMLAKEPLAYGGELLKKRKARQLPRTLDTKNSMHLVLKSSKAKGEWSFYKAKNQNIIQHILVKFAKKYGVKIGSMAYAGNHLHAQIKLSNRHAYKPFIRAITAAIAMAITGVSRWSKTKEKGQKFWDYRPFTRVVRGLRAVLTLRDYIYINNLEGCGYTRNQARFLVEWERHATDSG